MVRVHGDVQGSGHPNLAKLSGAPAKRWLRGDGARVQISESRPPGEIGKETESKRATHPDYEPRDEHLKRDCGQVDKYCGQSQRHETEFVSSGRGIIGAGIMERGLKDPAGGLARVAEPAPVQQSLLERFAVELSVNVDRESGVKETQRVSDGMSVVTLRVTKREHYHSPRTTEVWKKPNAVAASAFVGKGEWSHKSNSQLICGL